MPGYVEGVMNEYQQKVQKNSSMHHTNGKDQIMGPKLSGQPMIATNLSSNSKTEHI